MVGSVAPRAAAVACAARERSSRALGLPAGILGRPLALWQAGLFQALRGLKEFQLPYPFQIAEALRDRWDILLYDALVYTGFEAVVGLLIGATIGFLCAWLFVVLPP